MAEANATPARMAPTTHRAAPAAAAGAGRAARPATPGGGDVQRHRAADGRQRGEAVARAPTPARYGAPPRARVPSTTPPSPPARRRARAFSALRFAAPREPATARCGTPMRRAAFTASDVSPTGSSSASPARMVTSRLGSGGNAPASDPRQARNTSSQRRSSARRTAPGWRSTPKSRRCTRCRTRAGRRGPGPCSNASAPTRNAPEPAAGSSTVMSRRSRCSCAVGGVERVVQIVLAPTGAKGEVRGERVA